MIEISQGNLLEAPVEALVNTVNTQGIMGTGIALQFKQAFPAMFRDYEKACKAGEVRLGKMHVYDLGGLTGGPRWIINFPTKGHWRELSRLTDIEAGLEDLIATVRRLGIRSIAVPPLGCGNGGLNWADVRPRIEAAFASVPDVKVHLFAPGRAPDAEAMPNRTERPKMTVGQAALIALMDRYLKALLDPFVSLLEIHKLMYFLQETGQELKLQYEAKAVWSLREKSPSGLDPTWRSITPRDTATVKTLPRAPSNCFPERWRRRRPSSLSTRTF